AANAVVLMDLPPNSTAVGVPARVVKRDGVRVGDDMVDQVHIPDPVSQELCRLRLKVAELERRLEEQEQKNQ
ncbi:MAG: serine O-acetyltransferase, partial [Clostridia bacterium]|nr:serine O-acetyltransferase [Clostridia bacterium]